MAWELPKAWEDIIDSVPDGEPRGNGVYQRRGELRQRKEAPRLGWWRERLTDARALRDRSFEPMRYVVPQLIPEGVTLLAGRPKLGKSWLLLQIACAVANGSVTLVAGEQRPCGDALYLALEDSDRRMQRRLTKYFGTVSEWPALQYATQWLRLDEGGLDGIGEWCLAVERPTLVIIDTLQRVRPPKHAGQSDYDADMQAAEGLIRLCREHSGLSVICAHHDRKQGADDVYDTISGTLGLQGGADTIALLKRAGGGVTLYVKGRDLAEEMEKALNFDRETCRWHVLGEADEVAQSNSRRAVLELIEECGTLTPRQLADRLEDISYHNAKQVLWRMARDGVLENTAGTYRRVTVTP